MNFFNKNEFFLLEEIVKNNFSSKYKDSVLGILWSVLNPLLMMILFTILFSTTFGPSIEFFAVYFLAGKCIFDYFSNTVSMSMYAIKGKKNILETTSAPKYVFIIGGIISELMNLIISVLILIAVMIVLNVPFHLDLMALSIIPIISMTFMVIGLGLILSILCVYYTDIFHLWAVVSTMLMYSSALFFPMEMIPEPYYSILLLNPLYWGIDQFRKLIYQGTFPSIMNIINLLLISLIILVIGVIIFKKYERKVSMEF